MKDLAIRLFQPRPQPIATSVGLLLMRLIAGFGFILHGWGKIKNPFGWMGEESAIPGVFQALAALSEFGGGITWMIGLVTPLASFGLFCTMVVATLMHAVVNGDPFVNPGGPSYELALLYWGIAVVFLTAGPGRFSLDAKLFGERRAN